MAERAFSFRLDQRDYDCLQAMSLLTGDPMATIALEAIRTGIPGDANVELLKQQRSREIHVAAAFLLQRASEQEATRYPNASLVNDSN